jgi:glycosyltransferase involved in cell wall biosynthesis
VGGGEQQEELERLAAALGIKPWVRFLGSRPWAELPELYAAADIFVLPSLFEPWGAVVIEAMACSLPVVVTDRVGSAPDLVRPGENGWIVPAGESEALADALAEAFADSEAMGRMSEASARIAASWGEDACVESFVAAVRCALERSRATESRARKGKSQGCTG